MWEVRLFDCFPLTVAIHAKSCRPYGDFYKFTNKGEVVAFVARRLVVYIKKLEV